MIPAVFIWARKRVNRSPDYHAAIMRKPPVILCYHGIAEVEPRFDPVRLFVSPDNFRTQINRLKSRGYEFLTMTEFGERLGPNGPPPGICAITFDDGTVDHATTVPELLSELEVPGTIYVCPELLGEVYPWADEATETRFMTRLQLEALVKHPFVEIGAHTNTHVVLDEADFATAFDEMDRCRKTLASEFGIDAKSFCYPRCRYTPDCLPAAAKAGYTTAVSCCPLSDSWDRYALKRECIHTPDGRITFALKSRGMFQQVRGFGPARLVRAATRRYRHRAEHHRA